MSDSCGSDARTSTKISSNTTSPSIYALHIDRSPQLLFYACPDFYLWFLPLSTQLNHCSNFSRTILVYSHHTSCLHGHWPQSQRTSSIWAAPTLTIIESNPALRSFRHSRSYDQPATCNQLRHVFDTVSVNRLRVSTCFNRFICLSSSSSLSVLLSVLDTMDIIGVRLKNGILPVVLAPFSLLSWDELLVRFNALIDFTRVNIVDSCLVLTTFISCTFFFYLFSSLDWALTVNTVPYTTRK